MADRSWIGDGRARHPIPMSQRNVNVPKDWGGSFGYRGAGYAKMREKILQSHGYRSSINGMPASLAKLEVDHIIPYRVGGLTPHTNERSNLRVVDFDSNRYSDNAQTFRERKRRRSNQRF